eukprot:5926742-Amphidinium_carterae.1
METRPGWCPFGAWFVYLLCHLATLLSTISTVVNVLAVRAQTTSTQAQLLPMYGEACERMRGVCGGKRSRESPDPTVFGAKRAKLDNLRENFSGPLGWTHDLTQDGDVEANPGPAGHNRAGLGTYLTWITGDPPD